MLALEAVGGESGGSLEGALDGNGSGRRGRGGGRRRRDRDQRQVQGLGGVERGAPDPGLVAEDDGLDKRTDIIVVARLGG